MTTQAPPPPASISRDEYTAADSARQHFAKKSRLSRFLSVPSLRRSKKSHLVDADTPIEPQALDTNFIRLDSSKLDVSDDYADKYEWAIVYENQRGMTLFDTPYYSRLSLLPSDPSPFTIPNTSPNRSEQLPTTLAEYPLPDGNWRWVSKSWMIDMRSDSGEVQHDGFEYNWMFRTHKWRAEVGTLSAGGWVRRRRWVRLMMRPAKQQLKANNDGLDGPYSRTPTPGSSLSGLIIPSGRRHSVGSAFPPSVASPISDILNDLSGINDIWLNDDVDGNWNKCRLLMRRLGRDGRKLELWKSWLSHYHPDHHAFEEIVGKGKARDKQWTEDDTLMASEMMAEKDASTEPVAPIRVPPKEYLVSVLRIHGDTLLQSFIYPDSRAKFLMMLGLAGLLPELNIGLGIGWGASEMDFWSYTNGLAERFPELMVAQVPPSQDE